MKRKKTPVECVDKSTNEIYHFSSQNQASKFTNLSGAYIYLLIQNKRVNPKYSFKNIDVIDQKYNKDSPDLSIGRPRKTEEEKKQRFNTYQRKYMNEYYYVRNNRIRKEKKLTQIEISDQILSGSI